MDFAPSLRNLSWSILCLMFENVISCILSEFQVVLGRKVYLVCYSILDGNRVRFVKFCHKTGVMTGRFSRRWPWTKFQLLQESLLHGATLARRLAMQEWKQPPKECSHFWTPGEEVPYGKMSKTGQWVTFVFMQRTQIVNTVFATIIVGIYWEQITIFGWTWYWPPPFPTYVGGRHCDEEGLLYS